MITVWIVRSGIGVTKYRGKSRETIAKRIFGRSAIVSYDAGPNSPYMAHIVKRVRVKRGMIPMQEVLAAILL